MRSFFLVIALSGCAWQQRVESTAPRPSDASVWPLHIEDPYTRIPVVVGTNGFGQADTRRTCTATFVAPNIVVTSPRPFPKVPDAFRAYRVNGLGLVYGETFAPADPTLILPERHIALLRMQRDGQPLVLRDGDPVLGEALTLASFSYESGTAFGDPPVATRTSAVVHVSTAPIELSAGAVMFHVDVKPKVGMCGGALLDTQGRLAGIIVYGLKEDAVAVSATTIRKGLAEIRAIP